MIKHNVAVFGHTHVLQYYLINLNALKILTLLTLQWQKCETFFGILITIYIIIFCCRYVVKLLNFVFEDGF